MICCYGKTWTLDSYVKHNLKRAEVLDYVKLKYPQYAWSFRSLDQRLAYFKVCYIDYEIPIKKLEDAAKQEIGGPGKLLGYRALNQKLRVHHGVKVPRHLTNNAMAKLDPLGLETRRPGRKRKRPNKIFSSKGPMWTLSVDGHDKLCGDQNSMFPLAIYGCLDTFSRKILYLSVCHTNSDPLIIGNEFLKFCVESCCLPNYIRMDKGTETGKLATIYAYMLDVCGVADAIEHVIYGPSTSNKINSGENCMKEWRYTLNVS